MKISHVINENLDIDEAIPFTKQWKKERQINKDIKMDIEDLRSDLKVWMKGSKLKNISIDQFKNFLNRKGLDPSTVDSIARDRTFGRTGIPVEAPLTSAEVNQYIEKAVRAGYQASGPKADKSKFARPGVDAGGETKPKLPAALVAQLNNLSSAERAALKAML